MGSVPETSPASLLQASCPPCGSPGNQVRAGGGGRCGRGAPGKSIAHPGARPMPSFSKPEDRALAFAFHQVSFLRDLGVSEAQGACEEERAPREADSASSSCESQPFGMQVHWHFLIISVNWMLLESKTCRVYFQARTSSAYKGPFPSPDSKPSAAHRASPNAPGRRHRCV